MAWMMELASLIFLTDVVLLFSKSVHFNATIYIFGLSVCCVLYYIVLLLLEKKILSNFNSLFYSYPQGSPTGGQEARTY